MITDQKANAKYVGVYVIGDTFDTSVQLATTHKPNWFRRMMTWITLGWTWKTIEELKKLRKKK